MEKTTKSMPKKAVEVKDLANFKSFLESYTTYKKELQNYKQFRTKVLAAIDIATKAGKPFCFTSKFAKDILTVEEPIGLKKTKKGNYSVWFGLLYIRHEFIEQLKASQLK